MSDHDKFYGEQRESPKASAPNSTGMPASKPIQALDFDQPGSASADSYAPSQATTSASIPAGLATAKNAPWWHSQLNLMICVFGLLALAALLFVVLAPPPNVNSIGAAPNGAATNVAQGDDTSVVLEDAPFDEKRLAQARTDSQEVLSELLASKKALEQKGVAEWAPQKFASAIASAELGDEVYKQQDFPRAIQYYNCLLYTSPSPRDRG